MELELRKAKGVMVKARSLFEDKLQRTARIDAEIQPMSLY